MKGRLDLQATDIDPLGVFQSPRTTSDYDASIAAATISLDAVVRDDKPKYPPLPIKLKDGERPLLYRGAESLCVLPCSVLTSGAAVVQGTAIPTNYRFVVQPQEALFCFNNRIRSDFFEVPMGMLVKCERTLERDLTVLELVLKDGRILRVGFRPEDTSNLFPLMMSAAFPQSIRMRFAFSHSLKGDEDGWKLYNFESEFARMGVGPESAQWRVVDNSDWQVSSTYPTRFFVPRAVSQADLAGAARFRTRSRVPALVWTQPSSGPLYRSSQPMVTFPQSGLRTSRSPEDERYLRAMVPEGFSLVVFDARPFLNAQVNRATGGGVEATANYEMMNVEFLNVPNIHAVRDAYTALQSCNSVPDSKYLSAVEKSGWLDLLSNLIAGVKKVTATLLDKKAALVHCSDGWDRTSQLCSLTQLCIDSHYRSLRGFATLIEKDWISFGHQFDRRLGHSVAPSDEQSPIFGQFLDAVHQLTLQFPTHFEFSARLLADLCYHAYSGCFGTFMCNSEQERAVYLLRESTPSVWTYVLQHATDYANPFFQPGQDEVLVPCESTRRLQVWHEVFSKWHADMFYPWLENASPEEHKEVLMRHAQEGLSQYKKMLLEKDAEIQQLQAELLSVHGFSSIE